VTVPVNDKKVSPYAIVLLVAATVNALLAIDQLDVFPEVVPSAQV
jgi:hypothetical protein